MFKAIFVFVSYLIVLLRFLPFTIRESKKMVEKARQKPNLLKS